MSKNILQRLRYFNYIFVPFAIAGIIAILSTGKGELFLWMNQWRHSLLDIAFRAITWLGSGLSFAVICTVLLFMDLRKSILGFLCFGLSSALSQLLKKLVFPDIVRPMKYFEDPSILNIVEGVKHNFHHSFPSGHTTSAFSLAVFLALISRKSKWGLWLGIAALITGLSRIYLVQHFFEDVYAGAWIGTLSSVIVFLVAEQPLYGSEKFNRSILRK